MDYDELPPLIRALLDPAAYPTPHPAAIELRQTHISYILLADDRVYKIKKPVNFGFIDYSTPGRRAYYCRQEVRLNQRLAPQVYLGVEPVVSRRGGYFLGERGLGGRGKVVERAVVMRRLPEAGMLPRLLERDAVDAPLVERIAARLAAIHAAAPHGPSVARHGRPSAVRRMVESNLARVEPFVGRTIDAARFAHLQAYTAAFLKVHQALLRQRAASGFVHDGHGDLHAASVCLLRPPGEHASAPADLGGGVGPRDGDSSEPRVDSPADDLDDVVFFDCIDFAPRLRCTDVAAEVAFLAMDLDRYGRVDLRAAFVDAFVAASADPDLLALLPFYQSYRATVRGLVASLAADDPRFDTAAQAAQASLARAYFDLADHAYAGAAPRPILLLLGGLPASGKSTLARALAGRLAAVALSSDVVRKRLAGLPPTARRTAAYNEGLYTPAGSAATYATLLDEARAWLARGVSVVLDASFRLAADRTAAVALADALGVPWLAVECQASLPTTRARLTARAADPAAISDADWTIYQQLAAEWEPWQDLPAARCLLVDTGAEVGAAVTAVLARVRGLV